MNIVQKYWDEEDDRELAPYEYYFFFFFGFSWLNENQMIGSFFSCWICVGSVFFLTVLEKNILLCSLLVTLNLHWVVVRTMQVCVEFSGMFPFVPWDSKMYGVTLLLRF